MLASWVLPVAGFFIFDGIAIKFFLGTLLVINIFIGGSVRGASMMIREGTMTEDRGTVWEATNLLIKTIIAIACIATFFLYDNAKPIKGIYTEVELQKSYVREKQAFDASDRSYTQTIGVTALARDSATKRMWNDAVKKRNALRKEWERRKNDFEATRESLR